jgi:hypothetical protein
MVGCVETRVEDIVVGPVFTWEPVLSDTIRWGSWRRGNVVGFGPEGST